MTLLAGVFCRTEGGSLSDLVCDELRSLISRSDQEQIQEHRDPRFYLAKIDIGAFQEPGHFSGPDDSISFLTGEPLLDDGDVDRNGWRPRDQDLALIHEQCIPGHYEALTQANGAFSAVVYQPTTSAVTLIVDKMCLRPLYFWANEDYLVFSSTMRLIEGLSLVPKRMDSRAVAEVIGMGYPLSDRTPYSDVFLMKAGEVVQVNTHHISRTQYWRWDHLKASQAALEDLSREVYLQFDKGIARRLRNDRSTVAYLTGGLDSRCVVSSLSQHAVVHTFNFARPNTQDQVFGREFAEEVDAIHTEIPKQPGDQVPDYSQLMANAWNSSSRRKEAPPERPMLVWSGEGGSVSLGHVHLSPGIVDWMRTGHVDDAIQTFLKQESFALPIRLFRPELQEELLSVLAKGIREELEEINCKDPGRSFYLFLMLNDQRRKLARHFENIDLHRLEFQLPFFDSAFLSSVITIPVDQSLGHKFYASWLKHFPLSVRSVAWQAYPGHEPCPVPTSQQQISYQWDAEYLKAEGAARRQSRAQQARRILSAKDFPEKILSRRHLRLASWIHSSGWRDYEYIIDAARTYYSYWKICEGNINPLIVAPPGSRHDESS